MNPALFVKNYQKLTMVKGYDPHSADISALFYEYLVNIWNQNSQLDIQDSKQLIHCWIQHSPSTSQVYQQFQSMTIQPKIILKKKCKSLSFFSSFQTLYASHFPASQSGEDIIICLNHIRTKIELKENLDRELTFMYELHRKQSNKNKSTISSPSAEKQKISSPSAENQIETEEHLARSIYQGCLVGYQNYLLNQEQTNKMARSCAKHIFFRKTNKQLPIDRLYRYANQLIDDIA